MVWLAATVCGVMLAERFSMRQKTLENLLSFFCLVKLEVTHYLLPFSEAVIKIADGSPGCKLKFVNVCVERLRKNEDFPLAWEKSLEQEPLCIGRDDTMLLSSFGKTVCQCDINGVEEILAYYSERFEKSLSQAVRSKEKYSKLCMFSGLFAGGVAFMIII